MSTPADTLFGPLWRLLPGHQSSRDGGDTPAPSAVDASGGRRGQPRGTPPTRGEIKASYARGPSFSRYLPWVEYLADSGCFLLEDGLSVGVAAEIMPVPTEGRSQEALSGVRDQIESAFQDAVPEYDTHPWVIQIFAGHEIDPTNDVEALREHAAAHLLDDAFTRAWLEGMERHLRTLSRPGEIFHDDRITNTRWRGQTARVRLLLYRWLGSSDAPSAEEEANHVYERLAAALTGSGARIERMDGAAFHHWLLPWFNPAPASADPDPDAFYQRMAYPGDAEIARLAHYDLGEDLIHNSPVGDVERGVWYFDGRPHRAIPVEEMRRAPDIGHITGEMSRSNGQAYNAIMDRLPEDTVMVLTIVVTPQEPLEDHINRLRARAVGDSVNAAQVRADCDTARSMLAAQHKLYQYALTFFIRGVDEADLRRRTLALSSQLQQAKLKPVAAEDEVAPLNTYLRWLPMAYNPADDKRGWYTQLAYVQHLANLAPFFARSRGTQHPGLSFFNRGGGTFSFDPLSLQDRTKNGHMLVFGPTGAGKSATLNAMFSQVMALRRPRLFIIEVGNSFGLLADDLERHGLSVNKVRLAPGSAPALPLFAEAARLLDSSASRLRDAFDRADERRSNEPVLAGEDEAGEEGERDLLGEMEITARLMITGGDPAEDAEFRRSDRRLVRDAIYRAAAATRKEKRQCLAEDVRNALFELSRSEDLPTVRRAKAHDMAESMGLFCDGFDGQVFNREGAAWPECDVTVVDLAHYARDGYEAQLALAVVSLTNIIIGLAERDQYSGRAIIQAIDECHIVTVNPLLSPYLLKAGKMGRKLSYWIWLATQNLEDFPDAATRLLNMIEWFVCLVTPPDEVEQLARFKALTDDQKALIKSATKVNGKYTEGVVLADRLEALFRIVPPSRYLALAGTEGEEKAARRRVMDALGCSELDAALHIAARLDEARGMKPAAGDDRLD